MFGNYISLDFFGILACFAASAVAHEGIVGGVAAGSHEFPYQVSIEIDGYGHGCGGGIISDQYILTAANCVINVYGQLGGKPIKILAGTKDLRNNTPPAVLVEVSRVYTLKEYSPRVSSTTGDIAVLKLKQSLELWENKYMEHLRVPRSKHEDYTNVTAQIAGFGWTWARIENSRQYGGRNSTRLHFANADVLTPEECKRDHPSLRLNEKHLCARIKQHNRLKPRGVCVGDGGSPLVYRGTVIGVFSLGPMGCSENGTSAIYTRVSYFSYFIRYIKLDNPTKFMITHDLQ